MAHDNFKLRKFILVFTMGGVFMKQGKKAMICLVSILSVFVCNGVYGMETEENSESYYDDDGNEFKVHSDEEELRRIQEAMDGTSYQVSLEKFRNEDSEYRYGDVLWKSSFDEVKEKLGEQVSECEMEGTPTDSKYRFLKHTAVQELEGQKLSLIHI